MLEEKLFYQASSLASIIETQLYDLACEHISKDVINKARKRYDAVDDFSWEVDTFNKNFRVFIYDIIIEIPYEDIGDIKKEPIATMIWYNNYYDQPLDGLCLYQNKFAWFQLYSDPFSEPDLGLYVYQVFEMNDEEVEQATEAHKLGKSVDFSSNKVILDKLYDFQFCMNSVTDDN